MYTALKKTLLEIERCLPAEGEPTTLGLHWMYDLTPRLMSQELAVIYDREAFGGPAEQEQRTLAEEQSTGANRAAAVTLTVREPLPAVKRLTEAVEEQWKAMLHDAISEAARQERLPYFEKAMVEIEIVTPRGSDNARVWDTSNRAIQVILNNLKGILFSEDNMEHLAVSVTGRWGEKGATIIRVSSFGGLRQIGDAKFLLAVGPPPALPLAGGELRVQGSADVSLSSKWRTGSILKNV